MHSSFEKRNHSQREGAMASLTNSVPHHSLIPSIYQERRRRQFSQMGEYKDQLRMLDDFTPQ